MSGPSTTDYWLFDSDAPMAFSAEQKNLCCIAASITLLLYDHVVTLDKEVEWIWTLRWRLPKIIFFINRYVIAFLILLHSIPDFIFPVSISFCDFHLKLGWLSILNFAIAELLLVIRVCSLYDHRKLVVWSLGSLCVLTLIGATVMQQLYARPIQTTLLYKFLPGCGEWNNDWPDVDYSWALLLAFEGILVLLAVYKLILYRNTMNRTIALLARDSIVYFVIVGALLALSLALQFSHSDTISITVPGQCASCIAVGRMMMNLRGLIMDDPRHTLHLQTLQFDVWSQSGTETSDEYPCSNLA